jgi:hypothetical protein
MNNFNGFSDFDKIFPNLILCFQIIFFEAMNSPEKFNKPTGE